MHIHLLMGALVAAGTAAQCLDILAQSRLRAGFRAVGFRHAVRVPVIERLTGYRDWAQHAGWPSALMNEWGSVARSLPDGAPGARLGELAEWRLPDPRSAALELPAARRAVQHMRDADMACGVTVRVARPFGSTGCVTWFGTPAGGELDPESRRLLPFLAGAFFAALDRTQPVAGPLTEREIECLRWAALGRTDKEIARVIGRSSDTVRFHMKSILRKLGTTNRTHAVALGVHAGLVTPLEQALDAPRS